MLTPQSKPVFFALGRSAMEISNVSDWSSASDAAVEPSYAAVEPADVAMELSNTVVEPSDAAVEPSIGEAEGKIPCLGCGRVLRIRTLAEKHNCVRKLRKSWKTDPDKLQSRRRAAAERRFLARQGRVAEAV